MDQIQETNDVQEIKTLLREILQMQEQLLQRVEKLEESLRKRS